MMCRKAWSVECVLGTRYIRYTAFRTGLYAGVSFKMRCSSYHSAMSLKQIRRVSSHYVRKFRVLCMDAAVL